MMTNISSARCRLRRRKFFSTRAAFTLLRCCPISKASVSRAWNGFRRSDSLHRLRNSPHPSVARTGTLPYRGSWFIVADGEDADLFGRERNGSTSPSGGVLMTTRRSTPPTPAQHRAKSRQSEQQPGGWLRHDRIGNINRPREIIPALHAAHVTRQCLIGTIARVGNVSAEQAD